MSTRPIDLQNVLSKTQEVGRVQKVQDETPALYQEAAAAEASREADKRKESVPPSPRGEEDGVRPTGRESRRGAKGKDEGRPEELHEERPQGSGHDGGKGSKHGDDSLGKGRFIDVEV